MAERVGELIKGFEPLFPNRKPHERAIHASGVTVLGWFNSSEVASKYCRAEHFSSTRIPVTVRFSNGNGQQGPDRLPQVRGMAVKFHIGCTLEDDGTIRAKTAHPRATGAAGHGAIDTDLICTSSPVFMAKDADAVLAFQKAASPVHGLHRLRGHRWLRLLERFKADLAMCPLPPTDPRPTIINEKGLMAWAQGYPPAHQFAVVSKFMTWQWDPQRGREVPAPPPRSYARTSFHAVHAFEIENSAGDPHMVRFTFEPADGVRKEHRAGLEDDYLGRELEGRLADFPTRFNLRMQLADPWDDTTDPTTAWPRNRRRVVMGSLRLERLMADQEEGERLSFNPGRLVDGIAMSSDPILQARVAVYNEAQRRRGAKLCPVSAGGL